MPAGKVGTFSKPAFLYPMGAIGVLAIVFFVYYFAVTARQETSLNRRALRALAAVADGFHNRVLNLATVVGQAGKKQNESKSVSFETYLKEQSPDLVAGNTKETQKCEPKETTIEAKLSRQEWNIEFKCGGWPGAIPIGKAVVPYLQGLPSQIFDEVLIASDQGAVLHQSGRTGILINHLAKIPIPPDAATVEGDSPKNSPAPSILTLSQSTTVSEVSIGGQNFKFYMMPIPLLYRVGEHDSDHMVAVGLILSQRFRSESMALPGAALNAFGLSVLVIIFAAWPILKFKFMRRTDRLPRRSTAYFFLTILGTSILLFVLGLHLWSIFVHSDIDRNLGNLSQAIEGNLTGELRRALRVMTSMNASPKFIQAMTEYSANKNCNEVRIATKDRLALDGEQRLLGNAGLQLSEYPYFDRVIWADNNGNQHFKWEVGRQMTSPSYIGDREYFRGTVNGDLWRLAHDSTSPWFRVDPVFSRTTGEYRAVISIAPRNAALCRTMWLPVMSMIAPLLSLTDPIMPPDYGFALLDREGKVLFHSTSALSGRGNFLDDLDDPRDLRAAMLSGQELNFWARYQGLGMRVHSTPLTGIAGSSWTLVVFHELFQNEAQNAERIALFAVLALAYFVIVCIMVLSIPIESVTPTWIWPSDERKGAYLHLILAVLLIVPAFYFLIFELEEVTPILIAAFVIPLLTLAAAIFKLKNRKGLILAVSTMPVLAGLLGSIVVPSRSALLLLFLISAALSFVSVTEVETWLGKLRRPSTSSSFALLSALLLMISGILPCTAFFKVAYDYQASLLTRRWQMQTIEALATREARVKDQYRMIPLTSNDASGPDETSRWLFLRRRLEETTDRYDTVPFNLQGRSLSESSFTNIVGTCEIDLPPRLLTAIAGRIPYGKGTLTHSFSQISNSADGKWRWCRESDRRIRLAPGAQSRNDDDPYYNLPATRAFIKAATGDSVFLYPTVISEWPRLGPWSMLAAATAFLAAWWLAYVWIKPTLQLMFRKDPPADPLPELSLDRNTTFDNDMILLAADPREASAYFRKRLGTHVVDFADVLRGTPVDYRSITMPHVVIDHFDHQLGSAKADASRLEVLEGLLFADPARRLLLLSSTDPKFFFKESNADAAIAPEDALRWSRCLHNFKTVQLARHDQPRDGEYRLIWQASTASEKAALYQLARDGLANPQNTDALRHLQLRGLIAGWPLEIRDAHFADYVKRVAGYAERKSWQKQDSSGIWEGIRLTVVVVLLGMLAAVLFFNQQTYLSYIVTGLSVLTPLSKLLTEVKTLPLLLGFGGKKE